MSTATPIVDVREHGGTGLDYLQRVVTGEFAQPPIGLTLGFRIAAVAPGKVTIRGNPDERSYNLISTIHGGWAAAVLDTALALACLSQLSADHGFTTLDIRVNYLRPITAGTGEVVSEGTVINAGKRVAYCEASLVDAAGKMLAHGTGSCLILPK